MRSLTRLASVARAIRLRQSAWRENWTKMIVWQWKWAEQLPGLYESKICYLRWKKCF